MHALPCLCADRQRLGGTWPKSELLSSRGPMSGWKAVHRLAGRFPDAFVQTAVGTTISL